MYNNIQHSLKKFHIISKKSTVTCKYKKAPLVHHRLCLDCSLAMLCLDGRRNQKTFVLVPWHNGPRDVLRGIKLLWSSNNDTQQRRKREREAADMSTHTLSRTKEFVLLKHNISAARATPRANQRTHMYTHTTHKAREHRKKRIKQKNSATSRIEMTCKSIRMRRTQTNKKNIKARA
jgi:hypothetical protein